MGSSVSFGVKGLGFLLAGSFALAACSGDGETGDRPDDDDTGGTSGTGTTGGTSGAATGGTSGAATGGTSGAATGGTGGTGAGPSCVAPVTECMAACTPATCETVTPPQALLTDFSNLQNGSLFGAKDSNGVFYPDWYLPGHFFGGIFAYPIVPDMCSADPAVPMYPLVSDACSGEWRLTGSVGTYSGFGVWMETCMIDMSAYTGISLRIGGNVGPSGTIKISVAHSANLAPDTCKTNKGTCTVAGCMSASTTITVPATPTVVTIPFASLTGGIPEDGVNPAEITGIDFALDCTDCVATPYELDLTIDDITLVE